MASGEEIKNLLLLYKNIEWQYRLSDYTDEALKTIQKSLDIARKELFNEISMRDIVISKGREDMVLDKLNDMTFGIQAQLSKNIQESAMTAGEFSYQEYNNIMSFDGRLADTTGFNFVSVSPDQLKSMVVDTPVGGKLLNQWVADTFELHIIDGIKTGIIADNLMGLSTDKVIDRLVDSFGLIKRDAEALARTYIADINNRAAEAVYKANSDIIKSEVWNAALEVSMGSGRGTCLRCAGMDGREFPIDEDHVRPPLHVKCRCFMVPKTLSYRELGLDIDEMKESLRPYTERGDKRKIIEAGQFKGDFQDFLDARGVKYQKDLLGPNRYQLLKDGVVEWDDLVDKKGSVRLLRKDDDGHYVGLAGIGGGLKRSKPMVPKFIPAKTVQEAETWAIENNLAPKVNYKKLTNPDVANAVNNRLKKLQDRYKLKYNSIVVSNRKSGDWSYTPMWVKTTVKTDGSIMNDLHINEGYFGRFKNTNYIIQDIEDARSAEWWVSESIEDIVAHEYAHRLTNGNIMKAEGKDRLFNLKHDTIWDYKNLGKYASQSLYESMAEIFARFHKDGFIKPEWKKLFNEFSEVKI